MLDADPHCSLRDCLNALRSKHTDLLQLDEDQACAMERSLHDGLYTLCVTYTTL